MIFLLSSKNLKYIDKVHVTRPIPGDNDVGGLILMTEFRYSQYYKNIVGFDSRHQYLSYRYRQNFMIFGHTYRTDLIFFCGAK